MVRAACNPEARSEAQRQAHTAPRSGILSPSVAACRATAWCGLSDWVGEGLTRWRRRHQAQVGLHARSVAQQAQARPPCRQ
eukprot:1839909-Rhodomonas_salina.4